MLLACFCCGVAILSALFDVPTGLMFVLSLAVSGPEGANAEISKAVLPESSATRQETANGCYFSRQAWLRTLKQGSGGAVFAGWPSRIFKTSAGRYYVPIASEKQDVMKLRRDPAMSCLVALSAAMENSAVLHQALGRAPALAELYIAHAFGSDIAISLLQAARATPNDPLADHFPNLDLMMPHVGALFLRKITIERFVDRLRHATRKSDVYSRTVATDHRATPVTFKSAAKANLEVTATAAQPTRASYNPRFQLTRMPIPTLGYTSSGSVSMGAATDRALASPSRTWSARVHRD